MITAMTYLTLVLGVSLAAAALGFTLGPATHVLISGRPLTWRRWHGELQQWTLPMAWAWAGGAVCLAGVFLLGIALAGLAVFGAAELCKMALEALP